MASEPRNMLVKLPYDLIFMIFRQVGVGNAMCMGLTCRQLYAYFKKYHPRLVGLDCRMHEIGCDSQKYLRIKNKYSSEEQWWTDCMLRTSYGMKYKTCTGVLAAVLRNEPIVKGYRISYSVAGLRPRMLNTLVYGGVGFEQWGKEHRLQSRYLDWSEARFRSYGEYDLPRLILPSPHNLGENWYSKAWKATVRNYDDFSSVREWKTYWTRSRFDFVDEEKNKLEKLDAVLVENIWTLYSDGIKTLGLWGLDHVLRNWEAIWVHGRT